MAWGWPATAQDCSKCGLCAPAAAQQAAGSWACPLQSWPLAVVLGHLMPLAEEPWIQSKET